MAVQCRQLEQLLTGEGLRVRVVQTNAAYRPAWVARIRGARAVFRLLPYLVSLWRMTAEADVVHVLANSGWAWHLYAAPAVWISRWRGVPVIVNYRGGEAATFLRQAPRWVKRTLLAADARVAPSGFLQAVFGREGIDMQIIPNVIDLARFQPRARRDATTSVRIVVTRNLEPIYDIGTALEAFALLRQRFPSAVMVIAGEGPEHARLTRRAEALGIAGQVEFVGRLDRAQVAELYQKADLMINPSTVDNMPNSLLEAYASGIPIVSTDVGGIPYIARDRETALLVPPRDPQAMADAACTVLSDPALAGHLVEQGLREARRYAWSEIRDLWLDLYRQIASGGIAALAKGP
jgi:glycosyltransferase involved in cell wall biosynthesis